MGLKLDKEFCYNNIRSIVEAARINNNFVRIDMEDYTTTSNTLHIYTRLREKFDNVGTVLQSYMRRSISDINKLLPIRPNLRICKGIYVEPYLVAYKDKQIINQNFAYIIEKLLINNCYTGIATHDEKVVWEALRLIDKYNVPGDKYEFQMLLGVEPNLRRVLIKAGHRLRVYIPFGAEWAKYSTRRLKENPDIVGHVMRKMFFRMLGNHRT
jgi:proline dehydrogenase